MNSTTESARISGRLSTVKELLEQLGSMKAEGIGARERLDFLQNHVPEFVEEFRYEDAFDVEARASSARRKHLGELSGTVRDMTNAWQAAPISQAVKDAGAKLAHHLSGFVEDAERQERHAETEMLAQVWDHSPDIRWLYPWMSAWDGPIYIPRTAKDFGARYGVQGYPVEPAPEDVGEPAKTETQLEEAKAELESEVTSETVSQGERELRELQKLWPDADKLEGKFEALEKEAVVRHQEGLKKATEVEHQREIVKEFESADLTKAALERRTREFDQGQLERRKFEVWKEDEASGTRVPVPPQPDELRRMRQEAWTQAVRDVTLEGWDFHLEAEGHVGGRGQGTAMIWELPDDRTSFVRLEVTKGDQGELHVRLAAFSRKLGDRALERELSEAQLAELHIDPNSFVQDALGPK